MVIYFLTHTYYNIITSMLDIFTVFPKKTPVQNLVTLELINNYIINLENIFFPFGKSFHLRVKNLSQNCMNMTYQIIVESG